MLGDSSVTCYEFIAEFTCLLQKMLFLLENHLTLSNISVCIYIMLCQSTVLELEVRLATEEEEKKLLQNRLEEVREEDRQQQEELRTELEKVRTR